MTPHIDTTLLLWLMKRQAETLACVEKTDIEEETGTFYPALVIYTDDASTPMRLVLQSATNLTYRLEYMSCDEDQHRLRRHLLHCARRAAFLEHACNAYVKCVLFDLTDTEPRKMYARLNDREFYANDVKALWNSIKDARGAAKYANLKKALTVYDYVH